MIPLTNILVMLACKLFKVSKRSFPVDRKLGLKVVS